MTIDIWLAFAAMAIFFVLLPSPAACMIAGFSLQGGRRTAVATVPGLAAGLSVALLLAMPPVAAIALYLPDALPFITWAGMAYLLLYVLWSFQDPRISGPIADNDNLPDRRPGRVFARMFAQTAFRLRYPAVLAALLVQFVDPGLPILPQLLEMQATFLVCVVLASSYQVIFPRRVLGRRRRSAYLNPAARNARTRFISRRAVSAGYRRIAA